MSSPQLRADGSPFFATPANLILLLFLAIFLGYMLGTGASFALSSLMGIDLLTTLTELGPESPVRDRQAVRLINGINHLFTFLIPGLAIAILAYGSRWPARLNLQRLTQPAFLLLGCLFILVAFPFAQWLYQVNQSLPLPASLIQMEESANAMIQALLRMEAPAELLVNLLVIALLPAFGEELVFRGLLQGQLQKLTRNPHLGIWVAALVFSLFHLQFQGFLPRLALGALLGYLYWWSGSLWVPMLAHFANNAIQVIAQYAWKNDAPGLLQAEQQDPMHWGWGLLSLGLLLGLGYYLERLSKNQPSAISQPGK